VQITTARIRQAWPTAIMAVLALTAVPALSACATIVDGPRSGTTGAHPARTPSPVDGFFGHALERQSFGSFGLDRTSILPGDLPPNAGATTTLRVQYPADSASQLSAATGDTEHGGAQAYLAWQDGPADDAYLRFYVRFPTGFDFVKGGKLPGLYSGRMNNGGKIPDGTNGFSTRYMWRAAGAGEVYAYLPTSTVHGTSLGRGRWTWPTGAWTSVEQHVRLNTPGLADGLIQVWLNGALVFEQTGLTYRTTPSVQIEGLFFSTFFGGGDSSWATPRDQYADLAGFVLAKQRIGP
jgi:hypothetical protein